VLKRTFHECRLAAAHYLTACLAEVAAMRARQCCLFALLSIALSGPGPLTAQGYAPKPGDPPAPTRDSLNSISIRGQMLAEYDMIASIATDSVMARRPDRSKLRGYVARQRGNRWDVAFGYPSAGGDTFFVAYEARQREADPDNVDVTAFITPRADTGYYSRAYRALDAARKDFGTPNRPYNAAILERPSDKSLWVYLMPAQVRNGVYPLGNDVRYQYSPDGTTLLAKRKLHNSILEYAPGRGAESPSDKLAAQMHTAVLDNIPEDTDVLHVLVRQPPTPEYVITDTYVYYIATDGRIGIVGTRKELTKDGAPPKGP
jgi:hypothetical protein